MAEDPKKLISMTDDALLEWTLSGEENSYPHRIGETVLNMRNSVRALEVAKKMEHAYSELSQQTQRLAETSAEALKHSKSLAAYTKHLAISTWAVALITLVTQVVLVFITLKGK